MADNCDPRKIDSNATGLSFAETICGRLPTVAEDGFDPTWYELEPNEYTDFGGDPTTMARNPINASRQRKKGVLVDMDATGGFNQDKTQTALNRLYQGFFFADFHEKATTEPMNGAAIVITEADAATDTIAAAEGLSMFRVNQLVLVSGFATAANNGVALVTAVTDTAITLGKSLVDEDAPDGVVVQSVGFQLAAAGATITVVGGLPRLNLTGGAPTAATGVLTVAAGNVTDGDTVDIGGEEYTFGPDLGQVPIGATDDDTAANFAAAINGGVIGVTASKLVTATVVDNAVTLTAIVKGTGSNLVRTVEAGANLSFGAATLTGGTGFSLLETGLIVGEWVFLGGDSAAARFATTVGFARIASIGDQFALFDKTTFTPAAETGVGKSVHLYTGLTLRNEKDPDLITTRYYEFERTLGKDADGTQAEYLTRSVANELTLNVPVADKLNVDVTFVSGDHETRTGAEGRKPGPFVPAPGEDAINTSSNIVRSRMSIIDPTTSRATALFAYMTEGTLTINNNVSPVKAVANLGSIDVSVGNFDVGGEATVLFSTVAAIRAVRANADVTYDIIAAANNAGFVYDIPLLTLNGGQLNVEPGEPVTIELEQMGAENPNGYTLLYTSFPFLPTIAHPVPNADV